MVYISNAFSMQMLGDDTECICERISEDEAFDLVTGKKRGQYIGRDEENSGTDMVYGLTARSCVGHADTATILSGILGIEIPFNRESISLEKDDVLVVGQYVCGRLPEGATSLPDGGRIEWFKATAQWAGKSAQNTATLKRVADVLLESFPTVNAFQTINAVKSRIESILFGDGE